MKGGSLSVAVAQPLGDSQPNSAIESGFRQGSSRKTCRVYPLSPLGTSMHLLSNLVPLTHSHSR